MRTNLCWHCAEKPAKQKVQLTDMRRVGLGVRHGENRLAHAGGVRLLVKGSRLDPHSEALAGNLDQRHIDAVH